MKRIAIYLFGAVVMCACGYSCEGTGDGDGNGGDGSGGNELCQCGEGCECGEDCTCRDGGECSCGCGEGGGDTGECTCGEGCECGEECPCRDGGECDCTPADPPGPQNPPAAFGAVPSDAQVAWHKMEYYMFIHFGPNTFTDKEWGNGLEDPNVFNPTNMNTDQWAETASRGGMTGIILTAKHHDGFCLWPSATTQHDVAATSWMGGKGDVVKSLAESCKKYNIKFGVYISPWDQNHPNYGQASYNQIFANQISELHGTNGEMPYGELFEQWFDGAKGAGVNDSFYQWPLFFSKSQENSIVFSNAGASGYRPGCRWIGNEDASMNETNWCTLNRTNTNGTERNPTTFTNQTIMNTGEKGGDTWIPGEADISIRPGWFWSSSTNNMVKSVNTLVDIYYKSVGRGATLLLNVPPDRTGNIYSTDRQRVIDFRARLDAMFADNLAAGAGVTAAATSVRDNDEEYFSAGNVIDDDYDTYWATSDGQTTGSIEITFPAATTFNNVVLQEYIPLGQRVAAFTVQYQNGSGTWSNVSGAGTCTTIGYKRILKFTGVTSTKLKINITNSMACPVINNVEVYNVN